MERFVRFDNVGGRVTPPTLLAALRELEPRAELVFVGHAPAFMTRGAFVAMSDADKARYGMWWLGAVRDNQERRKGAGNLLRALQRLDHPPALDLIRAELGVQGFAIIQQFVCVGDPGGTVYDDEGIPCSMVEDLRERVYAMQLDQGKAVFEARLMHTSGAARRKVHEQQARKYARTEALDHYRREVRDRVMFGAAGMTGGSIARRSHLADPDAVPRAPQSAALPAGFKEHGGLIVPTTTE